MGERTAALFCAAVLALFLISSAGAAALVWDGTPLAATMELLPIAPGL